MLNTQIHFAFPWVWLLLPLPWVLRKAWQKIHTSRAMQDYADRTLWSYILKLPGRQTYHSQKQNSGRLWLAAWLMAITALSGPWLAMPAADVSLRTLDIALVVDISPSMNLEDVTPQRLTRASRYIDALLDGQAQRRYALIAFSANAYRILPLTTDHDTIRYFNNALSTDMTRLRGSNVSGALELARQSLQQSAPDSRAVVLFTDGDLSDRESALRAAQRLNREKVPLLISGIGRHAGAPVRNEAGRFIENRGKAQISRLDESLLTAMAQRANGEYFPPHANTHRELDRALDTLENNTLTGRQRPTEKQGLHHWPLTIALILFLLATFPRTYFRHTSLPAWPALAMLTLFTQDSTANPFPVTLQKAYDALVAGDHAQALHYYSQDNSFDSLIGQGVAAYHDEKHQQARNAFESALIKADDDRQRAIASYNLANTLVHLNEMKTAIHHYRQTLLFDPRHRQASYNLSLVEKWQAGQARRQSSSDQERGSDGHNEDSDSRNNTIMPDFASLTNSRNSASATRLPADALYQAGQFTDNPERVLRHRIMAQDAGHPVMREERPW